MTGKDGRQKRELQKLEGTPGPFTLPKTGDQWSPIRAISIRCVTSPSRGFCQWHSHPFDELCLVTDDSSLTGKADKLVLTPANSTDRIARALVKS